MSKGKIIILNGVTSVGKTTLSKALQGQLDEPFYWLTGDAFVEMTPTKFIKSDFRGTVEKTHMAMAHTAKTFADLGINVIFETVILAPYQGMLEAFVEILANYPVTFVHVTCPLVHQQEREKERGNRPIGSGEAQLSVLNPQDTYDVTVDTYHDSLAVCGHKIIEAAYKPKALTAFKKLLLGTSVTVTVDRPLGTCHPTYQDMVYPINYGFAPGFIAPDGDPQDAYILGVDTAVGTFTGQVIAIICRENDVEDKWVVAPEGMTFTQADIQAQTHFQEKYFNSTIYTGEDVVCN